MRFLWLMAGLGSLCACACGSGGDSSGAVGSGGAEPGGAGGGSAGAAPIAYHYGETTPCDGHPNSAFLDGDADDFINPGQRSLSGGRFIDQGQALLKGGPDTNVELQFLADAATPFWDFDFSSARLGTPLQLGEYDNAERFSVETRRGPSMAVFGNTHACEVLSGKFVVTDIRWYRGSLVRLSAAFEQHCEAGPSALRGCVNYDASASFPASDGESAGASGEGGASGGAGEGGEGGAASEGGEGGS